MEEKLLENPDETTMRLLKEAMVEVMQEEATATEVVMNDKEHGVTGYETSKDFHIEQDIQDILDDAKVERDARNDGLIPPEKGTRKFATVPIAAIVDYHNTYGIDIMDAEVSRDKWEMAKFRMWIQKTHPELMVRDANKTKFHTLN